MIRAGVLVAALLLSCPAHAIPCWVVRKAVAQYGEAAVESCARAKGIAEKEIEKAKRCLR
jgi:hypothetical protein